MAVRERRLEHFPEKYRRFSEENAAKTIKTAWRTNESRRSAYAQFGGSEAVTRDQRVTTMKSVWSPVSGPRPWSDTTSEEPGTINWEI